MKSRKPFALAAAVGAALMLMSTQAEAHAKLVSSNPPAGATVTAPKAITLTFNEKVVPAFSGFELLMAEHNMKIPVKTAVSRDGKTITGTPQGAFMKGSYTIKWHAAGPDGHRMKGEVAFRVN